MVLNREVPVWIVETKLDTVSQVCVIEIVAIKVRAEEVSFGGRLRLGDFLPRVSNIAELINAEREVLFYDMLCHLWGDANIIQASRGGIEA